MSWSNAATGSHLDYVPFLLLCPDDTDVMLLRPITSSGLQVTNALAASQRRPKAAMGLNPLTQLTLGNQA